jgi:hypothetical protein
LLRAVVVGQRQQLRGLLVARPDAQVGRLVGLVARARERERREQVEAQLAVVGRVPERREVGELVIVVVVVVVIVVV